MFDFDWVFATIEKIDEIAISKARNFENKRVINPHKDFALTL
jgi:hypothetical protein